MSRPKDCAKELVDYFLKTNRRYLEMGHSRLYLLIDPDILKYPELFGYDAIQAWDGGLALITFLKTHE